MFYFNDVNNLTELQERRIQLLQHSPDEAARINSEFMSVKDTIIGKRNPAVSQPKKRLPRMTYQVEVVSDVKTYVELRGDCIHVSPPPHQAFNADYLNNQLELPKIETPATMAFFVPPLTEVPIYCFT